VRRIGALFRRRGSPPKTGAIRVQPAE